MRSLKDMLSEALISNKVNNFSIDLDKFLDTLEVDVFGVPLTSVAYNKGWMTNEKKVTKKFFDGLSEIFASIGDELPRICDKMSICKTGLLAPGVELRKTDNMNTKVGLITYDVSKHDMRLTINRKTVTGVQNIVNRLKETVNEALVSQKVNKDGQFGYYDILTDKSVEYKKCSIYVHGNEINNWKKYVDLNIPLVDTLIKIIDEVNGGKRYIGEALYYYGSYPTFTIKFKEGSHDELAGWLQNKKDKIVFYGNTGNGGAGNGYDIEDFDKIIDWFKEHLC